MNKPEVEFRLPAGKWQRPGRSDIWDQVLAHDPATGDATLLQR
jgi:hypothetical protein